MRPALPKAVARVAARIARESRAAVMIEMAFAIPLLVLVGFGGMEVANLVLTHTRISQIGLSAADNASRIATGSNMSQPIIREIDINEIFTGVEKQAGNLDFRANGRIILSSLERNTQGGQWIHWQRCFGDLDVDSSYGAQGDGATGTDLAGMGPEDRQVSASDGTAVMFVEVFYDYQPLLYGKWVTNKRLHSVAAFNVREARDLKGPTGGDGVYNPSPAATPSTC